MAQPDKGRLVTDTDFLVSQQEELDEHDEAVFFPYCETQSE